MHVPFCLRSFLEWGMVLKKIIFANWLLKMKTDFVCEIRSNILSALKRTKYCFVWQISRKSSTSIIFPLIISFDFQNILIKLYGIYIFSSLSCNYEKLRLSYNWVIQLNYFNYLMLISLTKVYWEIILFLQTLVKTSNRSLALACFLILDQHDQALSSIMLFKFLTFV